jgi:tetratricopeptide (TPR) repeat protein/serine/threonine protein kinase
MNADPNPVKALFLEAVEKHAPDQWPAFLDRVCAGRSDLRGQVEVLLQAHREAGTGLPGPGESGVPGPEATTDEPPVRERAGTVIGPYSLMEQIGEGGMGLVFVAEQQYPVRRKVALKVIKPGMDTRQVVARFEAERQALALMDHPNIAKVYDGGETAGGRPYFVMELVKGAPITEYCDQNQVPIPQRMELFLDVCAAVQHAHQKGIIHRDIKPSNVLVVSNDGTPLVKVIDFGIAKAIGQQLTDRTIYTQFAQLVGTPLYMSPEQAGQSGVDVDTRTDIYALGVLLYELLTGTTPFDKERLRDAAYDEIRRIIREEEPPKPSTRISTLGQAAAAVSLQRQSDPTRLRQQCRGELDWIVMKALEKNRSRRYETASAFAADVQRYLADEPVQACPPSAAYRLRKFARRNKTALAIAGLVLVCIALVGGVGGWAVRDRAARQREADGRAAEAMAAAEPLLRIGHPWDPALISAIQRVEAELEAGALSPDMRARAEQLQRDMRMLTDLDQIRLRQAESKGGEMFDSAGSDGRYRSAFAAYGIDVGALEATDATERVRGSAIREALVAGLDAWIHIKPANDPERLRLRAIADGADDNAWRRTFREAALAGDAERLKALAAQPEALAQPASVLVWLGTVVYDGGAVEEARAVTRTAQQRYPDDFWINYVLGRMLVFDPPLRAHRSDEAVGYLRAAVAIRPQSTEARCLLGVTLHWIGDFDGAFRAYEQAIAIDPNYAIGHRHLAGSYWHKKQYTRAVAECNEALRLKPDYADAWRQRAQAYSALKQWDKAFADYSEAIKLDPNDAAAWHNRGQALNELRQHEKAVADYSKALELAPQNAEAWMNRGQAYTNLGQWDKALADLSRAVELNSKNAVAWAYRGMAHNNLGRWEDGVADNTRAIELDPENTMGAMAWINRGQAYLELHQYEKAFADFTKAIELDPKNGYVWNNRGSVYASFVQRDKAMSDFTKAIELDPKVARFWHNRGIQNAELKQWGKAIADYTQAIELDPGYAHAWRNRGIAYHRLNKWDKALADLTKALELDPKLADAWNIRGIVHGRLKQWDEAVADTSKALELQPDNPMFQNNLAWFLCAHPELEKRDPRRAVELAEKAVKAQPKIGNWLSTLGVARYRAGDGPGAVTALQQALKLFEGAKNFDDGVGESLFFLAMAQQKAGHGSAAKEAYECAREWLKANRETLEKNPWAADEMRRYQAEAEEVLDVKKQQYRPD